MTASERFWAKVQKGEGCWIWTAGNSDGYGRFYFEGRVVPAHRWSYEDAIGPIPDGLVIDHLCRNHSCVNPAHMEPVTHVENVKRGIAADLIYARQAQQTHCKQGHELTEENVYWYGRRRQCRVCRKERKLKNYYANHERNKARKRAKYAASRGTLLNPPTEGETP